MSTRVLPTLIALVTTAALAGAQSFIAEGDVVTAGNNEIRVMDNNGSSSTGFGVPTSVRSILWDPSRPDSFICGNATASASGGILLRATFTSPGTMTTTQIAPNGSFAQPVQLSWAPNGRDVIVVDRLGQIRSVDTTTGAATPLTNGAQPWGQLTCGAIDPLTNDIYVGNSGGEIWRLASGTGGATMFRSGLGQLRHVLIDSQASPHYLFFAAERSFGRLDLDAPAAAAEMYFGSLGTPTFTGVVSAQFDDQGDFVIGTSNRVYRLPNVASIPAGGLAPTLLGAYQFSNASGFSHQLAVVGGTTEPFRLTVESVPVLGARIALENVPGPIGFGWIFMSTTTTLPLDSGPFFGIVPDTLTIAVMQLPALPGGFFAFSGTAPVPLTIPQLGMAPFAQQTWDFVAVSFSPTGRLLGRSNVERVTWR